MNTKTIVAGVLAGVVAYLLGWLLYGVVLSGTFADLGGSATGVSKSDAEMMAGASMVYLIIGQLAFGLFLAYVFSKWANISTLAGGAKAGAVIGAFITVASDFTALGTSNISTIQGVLLDVIVFTVIMAISGA
ncbi:MAG: hypothetical protein ACI9IP_003532, partial [Arcticibacterium sp.]